MTWRIPRSRYEAIRANPTLWEDTLFLITYDEGGGYWDSQLPSGALAPIGLLEGQPLEGPAHGFEQSWPPGGSSPYHFRWTGKRVPMVLVSPHLDAGLCSQDFEHASIPATLTQLWGLESPSMAREAQTLQQHLSWRQTARDDCPMTLPRSEYRSDKCPEAMRADAMTVFVEESRL